MCKCTPNMRTPFCGKENCVWPEDTTSCHGGGGTGKPTFENELREIRNVMVNLNERLQKLESAFFHNLELSKLYHRISTLEEQSSQGNNQLLGRWNSVANLLPHDRSYKIVRCINEDCDEEGNDFYFMAFWLSETNKWVFFDEEYGDEMQVTHWMSTPEIEFNIPYIRRDKLGSTPNET